jgi:hypothetical protein
MNMVSEYNITSARMHFKMGTIEREQVSTFCHKFRDLISIFPNSPMKGRL